MSGENWVRLEGHRCYVPGHVVIPDDICSGDIWKCNICGARWKFTIEEKCVSYYGGSGRYVTKFFFIGEFGETRNVGTESKMTSD